MFDLLERVAAQSGAQAEDFATRNLPAGAMSRAPGDSGAVAAGVLAGQARASRVLGDCAARLDDVTAASGRVDAALRHSAR